MDVKQIIDALDINLTLEQLEEYVSGKRIIKDNKELSSIIISLDKVRYNFADYEVVELYERYDENELTREQMSFHLLLLYNIATELVMRDSLASESKMQLIDFINDGSRKFYLDKPLPPAVIDKIRTFFKRVVAVC